MKLKYFLFALVLTVIMVSCKTNDFITQGMTLEFMGNTTTGYTWVTQIDDESVVSLNEDIHYLGKENVNGAPSMFVYTLLSKKPGTTRILFEYKRPWEDKEPEEVLDYDVVVKENGRIKLVKRQ